MTRTKEQKRAWQRMLSGRRLDLLDPSPLDIEIDDIAHGLARVARWNGQTAGAHALSVAQHSVLVARIARILKPELSCEHYLIALLHDGPEYVIGDMISPFKNAMGGNYHAIEDRLQQAIHLRYGLPAETPKALKKLIKQADRNAAYFEAICLAGFSAQEAVKIFGAPVVDCSEEAMPGMLIPMPAQNAQDQFLTHFTRALEGVIVGETLSPKS